MPAELDYLDHLARESARFAAAISVTAPDAPVVCCPEWDADDLLWHLGEVQWFWGTVVRDQATREQVQARAPDRPADRDGLRAFYQQASHDLGAALAAAAPEDPAWTWAEDQTVGFVRRRQAHEVLIHRIDAELAADDRTGMDPRLSADGVDEVLRVMYGGVPPWGSFRAHPGQTITLRAADTGDTWLVTLGQFTGTDPDDQASYDQPALIVADRDQGEAAAAEISAGAADLNCWLWNRPPAAPVRESGDDGVLRQFTSIIASGIQ
jgi:uncharacterized protein (TIGR03083 family)